MSNSVAERCQRRRRRSFMGPDAEKRGQQGGGVGARLRATVALASEVKVILSRAPPPAGRGRTFPAGCFLRPPNWSHSTSVDFGFAFAPGDLYEVTSPAGRTRRL